LAHRNWLLSDIGNTNSRSIVLIDEVEQRIASDALQISGPVAPAIRRVSPRHSIRARMAPRSGNGLTVQRTCVDLPVLLRLKRARQ